MAMASSSSCFDAKTLLYKSPREPLEVPSMNLISFLFRITSQRQYHHRLALADASSPSSSLTFSQLHSSILRTARALSFLGILQHHTVLILSPNSTSFPVAFFAVISLGAIATTSNPINTPLEISKQIHDSHTKLIITVPDLLDKVLDSGLPIILIGGNPPRKKTPSVYSLSELIAQSSAHIVPSVQIRPTDTAALLYSSGTTGVSKGVVLSHRNFIAAALQVNTDADLHGERDLTFLCIIPMFHVYGLSVIVFGQLQRGNTIVTMPKFDFIQMLQAIQDYRITNLPLVPPIMIALAKQDIIRKYDLSSVIEMTSGAAPLGKETLEGICKRMPTAQDVRQGYGMTETTGIASIAILKTAKKNYATVGPLVSGMEAAVVDPITGRRLPPNKQGELWLRGPNIMQGYLNNPEATAATLDKDGWLHTGDLVYIDDEGNIYIMDRLKELIKYKGLQVAPAELEALLLTHLEIIDSAVVPCPDDDAGEVPVAFVVRSAGSSLNENDVIKFVADKVAPYKKVRKVKFVDVIPKSNAGKILRRELVQQLLSKL